MSADDQTQGHRPPVAATIDEPPPVIGVDTVARLRHRLWMLETELTQVRRARDLVTVERDRLRGALEDICIVQYIASAHLLARRVLHSMGGTDDD